MARCKCKICGKELDSTTAYKVTTTSFNRYYCSQMEYEEHVQKKQQEKKLKNDIEDVLCNILNIDAIINTLIYKEWQDWNKIALNEVILEYLQENKQMLRNKLAGIRNTEFNKIKYLSTVLKNSLGDFQMKKATATRKIKTITVEEYVAKYLDPNLCFSIDIPMEDRIKIIINPDFEDDSLISRAIKKLSYDEFLVTPYWETITNYKYTQTNYKCEKCGCSTELRSHHKTYAHHGQEHRLDVIQNDLIVLCDKCHHEEHNIADSDDEI